MKGIITTCIFSALSFWVVNASWAQTTPHKCGTAPLSETEKKSLEGMMRQIMIQQSTVSGKNAKVANSGTSCIPIKVHDIRDGLGAGAVDMTWLNQDLANLNYHFQAANIEFYFCGAINNLNNDTYYDFDSAEEAALLTAEPQVTNAFNLYLVDRVIDDGSEFAGYAYFPANSLLSTVCIMNKNVLAMDDNGTIVHEYGHHFSLYHTFQGTSNGNADANAENVPRSGAGSNCTTRGDLLCDTHADPNGAYSGCTYTGGASDILGNPYTPPMDNIMSYYPNQCGGFFTAGQNGRIMAARTVRSGHSAYSLTCAATAVNAASGLSGVVAGTQINLSWTDNAANELGYLIERSTTSAASGFSPLPMGGVSANTTAYSDNTIASNTTYYYRIKASNGDCNTYSNVATVTTGLIYCVPVYSNGGSFCTGAIISNFTFTGNTIINKTTTQPECLPSAVNDYSATNSAEVTAGVTYNFSVTRSASNTRFVQVFIDFNQDGDFNDANEKILPDDAGGPTYPFVAGVLSGSVLIPATALNGTTRMRVVMRNQVRIETACETTSMFFGETEDYALIISGGALPVEFLSFTGESVNETVTLNWSTVREVGNDHFELERSIEGKEFSPIAEIKGTASASEISAYNYIDQDPFYGKNFYRLKQIDFNGKFTYSSIVLVDMTAENPEVKISPNPVESELHIDFATSAKENVSLEIQDLTGKNVFSKTLLSAIGFNEQEISVRTLPAGIYFLRVTVGGQLDTFRLVKQ